MSDRAVRRATWRIVLIRVIGVQVVTLFVLWLLQARYGW
jgi:hypothetical protein